MDETSDVQDAQTTESTASVNLNLPMELQILELFGRPDVTLLGPTDVGRLLNTSKGNASPKLKALAAAGYLEKTGEKYALGPAISRVHIAYMWRMQAQIEEMRTMVNSRVEQLIGFFNQIKGGQA